MELADATPKRNRPLIATGSFPVRGDNRGRGQIPPIAYVVVDILLESELVDIGFATGSGKRPDILDQGA